MIIAVFSVVSLLGNHYTVCTSLCVVTRRGRERKEKVLKEGRGRVSGLSVVGNHYMYKCL